MQKLKYFLLLIFFSHSAHAVLINVGSPLEITFSNLPFIESVGFTNQGGVGVELSAIDPLDIGDRIRLELFNDQAFSDQVSFGAIGTFIDYTFPTDSFGAAVINAFQGNEGGIRLTAIEGSVIINTLEAQAIIEGERYRAYLITKASVPMPSTLILFGFGLAGLGFARRKKA